MVFPQFFLSWGPNQSHVQRQEGRDVLPAAVGHEASGASDIVMYKMSHIPIYIYATPPPDTHLERPACVQSEH